MIARIWHGWTTHENADAYEGLIKSEVFDEVEKRQINGYRGVRLLRKNQGNEVEFISLLLFDTIENVTDFVGTEHEVAHVPDVCKKLLKRFDTRVEHFDIKYSKDVQKNN